MVNLNLNLSNRLINQLLNILEKVEAGANIKEEEVVGDNLIHRLNQPWDLRLNSLADINIPMTVEEKKHKGDVISNTFLLLIHRLFQGMQKKLDELYFDIDNAKKYRVLLGKIIEKTQPLQLGCGDIGNKISSIIQIKANISSIIKSLENTKN